PALSPRIRRASGPSPHATIRAVDALSMLRERLVEGTVRTDPEELAARSHDWWALALLREVRGDPAPAPVAAVFPASTEEVATVLAWADETGTAVTPRG